MKKTFIAAALVTIAGLSSCSGKEQKEAANTADETPVVEVSRATIAAVDQTKEYTANVEAFNTNNITPSTANRIKSITVDVGDRVGRGQVLATMDNSQATQLSVNLRQLERDYDRAVQLLKIGSGTQAAVDQLKAQVDAARAQYRNVQENTVLRSPISGVVTARNLDPGDMASGTPILTVGQISPNVKVVINITEADRSKISKGMPVTVSLDAFPDKTFEGKISRVYPAVDPSTRTFQAEVLVPNASARIFPGMFARVTVNHGTEQHVIVPDRAVVKQTGSGNKYVYVYKNGKVSYNKVEIGRRTGTGYEVLSGVADGDSVVIAGQSRLADGVAAQIKK